MKYLRLLGPLDWPSFPDRPDGVYRGVPPASRVPFAAAFLVKIDQNLRSMGGLRRYLHDHPSLAWLLGFDLNASLPSEREWARTLRTMHNDCLQLLLDQTVACIRRQASEIEPSYPFGDEVALDTKHILAWVRENNPKEFIRDRYDKHTQPKGDLDCKLGCKERTNQRAHRETPSPATPTSEASPAGSVSVGTFYWGYASGIVVTTVDGIGDIVLAEFTQPFNASEPSYFLPLMQQAERRLGRSPRFGALDAAFDAWYVYDYFYDAGGFAAVPLANRGKSEQLFDDDGLPLCPAGLPMPPKHSFTDHKGLFPQPKARYACPLLWPEPSGQACPIAHKKSNAGGCVLTFGATPGARVRHQLDRDSDAYKTLYAKRTAAERIFSQAVHLGIERPKLRNQRAIANYNTLTYVLLNLRALQRSMRRIPLRAASNS